MNPLINILKKRKIMPIDKFIDMALYNKKFGYYMKKNPFGKEGDFITSPLVSQLFGEMIAIWCVSFWEHIDKPKKILIVELGPGDGTLCKDLLNAFKNFSKFYNSLEIRLIEKSEKLKKIQKNKIKNSKVKWIKKIDELKDGPIIFIANEFFDSLPIKQICFEKNSFCERYVALQKNSEKIKFLNKKANKILVKKIKDLNLLSKKNIIEYPTNSIKYLNLIAKYIKKYDGGLLTFDYGYTKTKNQNTLQSVENHKKIDIFLKPSNVDITSHINFKLFADILKKNNLEVENVKNQNEFLQKLGIIERANMLSKTKNFKTKANLFYQLKKLLHYNEMGNLFKVLFAHKKGIEFQLGFK